MIPEVAPIKQHADAGETAKPLVAGDRRGVEHELNREGGRGQVGGAVQTQRLAVASRTVESESVGGLRSEGTAVADENIVASTAVQCVVARSTLERVIVWRQVHDRCRADHRCAALDSEVCIHQGRWHRNAGRRSAVDIEFGDVQEVRVLIDAHGPRVHHRGQHDRDRGTAAGSRDGGGGVEHAAQAVEHRDGRAVEPAAPGRPVDDFDVGNVQRLVEVEL